MNALIETARANAALIIVIAPLLAAVAGVAVSAQRLAWTFAVVGCLTAAVAALDLGFRAVSDGVIPPLADSHASLMFDGVTMFMAPLVTLMALLVAIAALSDRDCRKAHFIALFLLCVSGWLGALLASDLVSVFLALETAWLAATALVALTERARGALNGAMRMLSFGGVSSALFLAGVAFVFAGAGSVSVSALSEAVVVSPLLTTAGFGLLVSALATKAGAVPFNGWAGASFGRASGFASVTVGVISCVSALALIVRLAAHALSTPALGEQMSIGIGALGAVGLIVGSAQALGATSVRRLAAYVASAIGGGALLSASLGSPAGYAAALIQLFTLATVGLGLLGGAAAAGVSTMSELDGLARRAPLASAAIAASAASLMSAPLSVGFLGRWRLVEAAIGADWWWVSGAMVAAALAGVFFGGRLIERMYFRRAAQTTAPEQGGGWSYGPALFASIAATALGMAPAWLLSAADTAAALLADVAA